jgi:hypothetical protein
MRRHLFSSSFHSSKQLRHLNEQAFCSQNHVRWRTVRAPFVVLKHRSQAAQKAVHICHERQEVAKIVHCGLHDIDEGRSINSSGLSFCEAVLVIARTLKTSGRKPVSLSEKA